MMTFFKTLQKEIATAPTTNLKNALAVRAATLTVGLYWITVLLDHEPDPYGLGVLCAFILTWLFDGRKQFEVKRKTQWVADGFRRPTSEEIGEPGGVVNRRQNAEAQADGVELT
jgi:hypothetical protein